MADYDPVAPFYDLVHGSRKQTIKYIKQLIKDYHPKAKTLLSVACGTGTVCKALKRCYQITGVDISSGMLAMAEKKLPTVEFYQQDMVELNLNKKFDVIICLFASLNHVLQFSQWEKFFARVKDHLNAGGVFIVDILTELCLYNMVLNSPLITRSGKLISIGDISMAGEGQEGTVWRIKGYEVTRHDQRLLFASKVSQVSFAPERIEKGLLNHFSSVIVEDPEQEEVNERSELLYFICSL
ncbi:MAG: hypothetical protein A3E87_08765 [Gammaproteobacteria bacterium RIFCSPHIGHO2_12_FULL_35_23]|nr:MAG: hypothetical protein A3E87_08765 [Gammaproteobacteria bacterium RIFCSPHIGHO2_12_FULL_35_23]